MSKYHKIVKTEDGKYDVPKIINLTNVKNSEKLESQHEAANNAYLQCFSLLTEIKIMSKYVSKMTRYVSNCLKAVRKSVGTSINKSAPSQSIVHPTIVVIKCSKDVDIYQIKCSKDVDIYQIPVVHPNSYMDISDLKINYKYLDFNGQPTFYNFDYDIKIDGLVEQAYQDNTQVIKEFVPEPHSYMEMNNLDVDQIQLLVFGEMFWADDMPSNPSQSDPHDSGGDIESFVYDSEDSDKYEGV